LASGIVLSIAKFREDFGEPYQGTYVVPAKWQLAWTAASTAGLILGGLGAGQIIQRWGRQLAIFIGFLFSVGGVFAQVFAKTPAHLFAGKLLTGLVSLSLTVLMKVPTCQ
jgi:MFS family permease